MIKWFEKHNKISWLITIIIFITIFYLSSRTFPDIAGKTSYLSIIYHFFAFFFLTAFLLISIMKGKFNRNIFIIAIFIAILYGVSDEFHQYFVPGRSSTMFDIIIDTLGILAAGNIYAIVLKLRK